MGNVSIWEKLRLGLLWGTDLTQWDMDKYALYFAMYNVSGCDLLDTYGDYFFALTFILLGFSPFCGWFTDYTAEYQHITLIVSVAIQTGTYILIMANFMTDYNSLMAVWIIRQVAIFQSQTSVWKVVKLRLEVLQSDAEKLNEISVIINRIGNFGDIMSDSYEIIFLGIASLSPLNSKSFGHEQARSTIFSAVMICNILCLALSLSFTKSQLTKPVTEKDLELKDLKKKSEKVDRQEPKKPILVTLREWTLFVWIRLKYLYYNKIAWHTLMHYNILYIFYTIVSYPLTLSISDELSINTPENNSVCGGLIANLLTQGFVLNVTYLITTLMYTAFIVQCPPLRFYRWVVHIMAIILGVSVGILWMSMSQWPSFIMVSLAQVIPYYMYSYDFYCFTSSVDEIYYGFIFGIYGFLYQLLYIVPASILYIPFSNQALLVASLIMLVLVIGYSIYIAYAFEEELQAKPPEARSLTLNVSTEKDLE